MKDFMENFEEATKGMVKKCIDPFSGMTVYKIKASCASKPLLFTDYVKAISRPTYNRDKPINESRLRPVITPNGTFDNIAEAALSHTVTTGTMHSWLRNKPEQFYYKE
jgi:hypothetical protein